MEKVNTEGIIGKTKLLACGGPCRRSFHGLSQSNGAACVCIDELLDILPKNTNWLSNLHLFEDCLWWFLGSFLRRQLLTFRAHRFLLSFKVSMNAANTLANALRVDDIVGWAFLGHLSLLPWHHQSSVSALITSSETAPEGMKARVNS